MARNGKITQKFVNQLHPPSEGQRIVYDGKVDGFGVRITANGVVSFVLNYYVNGKKRRMKIGRHPEWSADAARAEALDLRKRIAQGEDPLAPATGGRTLGDLASDYLSRYALKNKRPSSIRNDQQMLNSIILPRLGAKVLSEVTRCDIEDLHHSLKATPYRANRVLALLSRMFSLAIGWEWRADNPATRIDRYHEDRRETWLSKEQLQSLESALDAYHSQDAANAIRLLILTGSREGEVLSAKWEDFDLKRATWTKPSHHTKQQKIEHVPLSTAAMKVLRRMASQRTSPYLFPGADTGRARVTIWRPWIQVCKASGLATAIERQGKRRKLTRWKPAVRIHDLRHSFASHLVSRGESLHIVGKLLGHTQPQTTARYAHVADESLRKAANRIDEVMAR